MPKSLDLLNVNELRAKARSKGYCKYYALTKKQLIDLIRGNVSAKFRKEYKTGCRRTTKEKAKAKTESEYGSADSDSDSDSASYSDSDVFGRASSSSSSSSRRKSTGDVFAPKSESTDESKPKPKPNRSKKNVDEDEEDDDVFSASYSEFDSDSDSDSPSKSDKAKRKRKGKAKAKAKGKRKGKRDVFDRMSLAAKRRVRFNDNDGGSSSGSSSDGVGDDAAAFRNSLIMDPCDTFDQSKCGKALPRNRCTFDQEDRQCMRMQDVSIIQGMRQRRGEEAAATSSDDDDDDYDDDDDDYDDDAAAFRNSLIMDPCDTFDQSKCGKALPRNRCTFDQEDKQCMRMQDVSIIQGMRQRRDAAQLPPPPSRQQVEQDPEPEPEPEPIAANVTANVTANAIRELTPIKYKLDDSVESAASVTVLFLPAPYWTPNSTPYALKPLKREEKSPPAVMRQAYYLERDRSSLLYGAWLPMYGFNASEGINDDTNQNGTNLNHLFRNIKCRESKTTPVKANTPACFWLEDLLLNQCRGKDFYNEDGDLVGTIKNSDDAFTVTRHRSKQIQNVKIGISGGKSSGADADVMVEVEDPIPSEYGNSGGGGGGKTKNCRVLELIQALTFFTRYEQLQQSARLGGENGTFWMNPKNRDLKKFLLSHSWDKDKSSVTTTTAGDSRFTQFRPPMTEFKIPKRLAQDIRKQESSVGESDTKAQWNVELAKNNIVLHRDARAESAEPKPKK